MNEPVTLSRSFAHLWLRWYTSGLEPSVRYDRRAEIRSDLAEHSSCRSTEGWSERRIARERLLRTVLGAPADLRWRREVAVARRRTHSGGPLGALLVWARWEWPTLAGVALGAFYLVFALYVFGLDALQEAPVLRLFDLGDVDGRPIGATIVLLLAVGLIAASAARLLVSATADIALVCLASPAMPFYWMVVPSLLAVTVIVGASVDLARQSPSTMAAENPD
jgi:hypothetical protein